jgi:integrating conjugative element protein (TIGR03765 family)
MVKFSCIGKRTVHAVVAAIFGICFSYQGSAKPVIIHDTGNTVPSVQYLSHVLHGTDRDDESPLVSFPVSTKNMTPGDLRQQGKRLPNAQWMTQPVFILGSDPLSRSWLVHNNVALSRLQAAGIVVSVPDAQTFKELQRISTVPLAPAPAPALVLALRQIGVKVYPIVVLTDGVVTQDLTDWNDEPSQEGGTK